MYEGKTADTAINEQSKFDEKVDELAQGYVTSQMRKSENVEIVKKIAQRENRTFDDLMKELSAEEVEALKKKLGSTGDIFEAEQRIEAIAADMVQHYIENILPNGFKAQVVCSTKMATVTYKKCIDKAIAERLAQEQAKSEWTGDPKLLASEDRSKYRNEELCKKIAFLKSAVVVSSEGTKDRYKDDTLNISGSGEKVRMLINEHLISLGINPKIKPVELMSPQFIRELEQNQSPKAKASEMEHAIRKHCKVHLDEDPVLYKTLSEKLEALIQKHKEDWDEHYRHLFDLRKEAEAGRKDEKDPRSGPFYDLIGLIAFGASGVPVDHRETVEGLTGEVLEKLKRTIGIINFWSNPPEVSKLKGELSDLLLFSNVDEIVDKSDKIVAEITALAKVRHRNIMEGGDLQT